MEKITFSFGKNWRNFVDTVSDENIDSAKADIVDWLGKENIENKTVLDIGSGSGIHSYCFHKLSAKSIFSFDYDVKSEESTRLFWERAGKPDTWIVTHGSVLDKEFLATLVPADIVYSWGVLHHTGDMWTAINNASLLVKPDGFFFISIYAKGPYYERHLNLKRDFNSRGSIGKRMMIYDYILRRIIIPRLKRGKNPFTWNEKKARGMNVYNDVVDWLGGLPYEVAHEHELTAFLEERGFQILKKVLRGEGGCHRLLYKKKNQ